MTRGVVFVKTMIGKQRWAIAEGYIPEASHGPEPEMTSHETICILDTADHASHVEIILTGSTVKQYDSERYRYR